MLRNNFCKQNLEKTKRHAEPTDVDKKHVIIQENSNIENSCKIKVV